MKKYIQPHAHIIALPAHSHLLAGSGYGVNSFVTPPGEPVVIGDVNED